MNYFNYFAAASILVMFLALWYGWRKATKVPRDPSEAVTPYDDGFELGDDDGYHDGLNGEARRPDLAGYDNDGTQFALGYFEGYDHGYERGLKEQEIGG